MNKSCISNRLPDFNENKVSNEIDFFKKKHFLKEEYQHNCLMRQLLHTTTSKPLNAGNPNKYTKCVNEDSFKYPKIPTEVSNLNGQAKNLTHTTNCFSVFFSDEIPTYAMKKDASLVDVCERYIQMKRKSSNHIKTSNKEVKEIPRKSKILITVIFGDSRVKNVKVSW